MLSNPATFANAKQYIGASNVDDLIKLVNNGKWMETAVGKAAY